MAQGDVMGCEKSGMACRVAQLQMNKNEKPKKYLYNANRYWQRQ